MKSVLHLFFSCISFSNLLVHSGALAIAESGSEIIDNSSSSVRITIANNDRIVELSVPSNGELASEDFQNPIVVKGATVQSDSETIRCFFLLNHGYPDGGDYEGPFGEVTIPFTPLQPLKDPAVIGSKTTYRVYCYDSAEDDANNDTFAIFVQNAYNQQGLIRVRVTAGNKEDALYSSNDVRSWAVLNLENSPQYAKLRRAVHVVALVGRPSQQHDPDKNFTSGPFCRAYFDIHEYDSIWYNRIKNFQITIQDRRTLTHLVCYDPRTEEEGRRMMDVQGDRTLPYSTKHTYPWDAIDVEASAVDDEDDHETGRFLEGQE